MKVESVRASIAALRATGGAQVLGAGHPYKWLTLGPVGSGLTYIVGVGDAVGKTQKFFTLRPGGRVPIGDGIEGAGEPVWIQAYVASGQTPLTSETQVSFELSVAEVPWVLPVEPLRILYQASGTWLPGTNPSLEILGCEDVAEYYGEPMTIIVSVKGPRQAAGQLPAQIQFYDMIATATAPLITHMLSPGCGCTFVHPLVSTSHYAVGGSPDYRWRVLLYNYDGAVMTDTTVTYVVKVVRGLLPASHRVAVGAGSTVAVIETAPSASAPAAVTDGHIVGLGCSALTLSFGDNVADTRIVSGEANTYRFWWFGVDGLWHTNQGHDLVVDEWNDVHVLDLPHNAIRFALQRIAGSTDFYYAYHLADERVGIGG